VGRVSREIPFGCACALALLAFSCQVLTDAHERRLIPTRANDSGVSGGGAISGTGLTDGGAGRDSFSEAAAADAAETEPPIPACPEPRHGPAMVAVVANGDPYCIDSTEVINAEYLLFLDAPDRKPSTSARCSWNADFTPDGGLHGLADEPVTNVDWCDAFSYCLWAGKRLCRAVGDVGDAYRDFAVAEVDEWYNACSSGGVNAYPYGDDFSGGACNGLEKGGSLEPVRAADACVTAADLYDLSGNVAEWEDACDGDDSASDNCRVRGGSYRDGAGALACAADLVMPRNAFGSGIGFRCCQGILNP
jgi:formylglycine-generating enzyme